MTKLHLIVSFGVLDPCRLRYAKIWTTMPYLDMRSVKVLVADTLFILIRSYLGVYSGPVRHMLLCFYYPIVQGLRHQILLLFSLPSFPDV